MYRLIIILLASVILSGCQSLWKPPEPQIIELPDPKCEALKKTLTVKILDIEPLNLDKYKRIEFLIVEDVEGAKWLTFSFDHYKDFAELMLELQNQIDIQTQVIEQMQNFYIQALEEDEDF